MADQVLPPTADMVVDHLDSAFPERCPALDWTAQKIWFEAGKREVVRYLIELRRRRDENLMEQKIT